VGSYPPNYNIGWAANVFCPPKKFPNISSRPNYTPVIPALVDSISDSRSLCALCSISQLVTSVNCLKNFPLIETKSRTSFNQRKVSLIVNLPNRVHPPTRRVCPPNEKIVPALLRHTVVLYRGVDAQCDKLARVVDRQSTAATTVNQQHSVGEAEGIPRDRTSPIRPGALVERRLASCDRRRMTANTALAQRRAGKMSHCPKPRPNPTAQAYLSLVDHAMKLFDQL